MGWILIILVIICGATGGYSRGNDYDEGYNDGLDDGGSE